MGAHFQITDLQCMAGDFRLGPLSLEMERNDYLVLLGPTGCGKTTLVKCIVGAVRTEGGRIFLGGREIGVMPPHRRRIGYVAQVNDLFPHLSVEENISFGLKYQRMSKEERRARVERYISLMGLEGMAHRCVGGLSGGESKKVALARSLAVEPELLLLDEPLGMLDHNQRKELLGVLKTVHQQLKTTTIHITHDRREAWGIAQKCAVMSGGRILQVGTVAEVFRAPKSRFVAEFLGSGNLFRGVFREGEVQISGVVLSVRKVPSFREGWVVVRPEQISLVREGGSFRVSGVVKSLHDFGEYIEVEVLVGNSFEILVHLSVDRQVEVGEKVYLDWSEDAMWFIGGE